MAKTWVIPDIHGYAETLTNILDHQIKPSKNDHLIFLGDYIDRGPNSKGVIDIIMNLEKSGHHITPLKGNHEDVCLKTREESKRRKEFFGTRSISQMQANWEILGGRKTLNSFGISRADEIPEKYIQWMHSLKYYIELDHFFAVHAGFNFKANDPFSDTQAMIWIRDYEVLPGKINNKKIIHGHNPVNLKFIKSSLKFDISHTIDLDNGIYFTHKAGYGNLIALELNSMEIKIQPVIENVERA